MEGLAAVRATSGDDRRHRRGVTAIKVVILVLVGLFFVLLDPVGDTIGTDQFEPNPEGWCENPSAMGIGISGDAALIGKSEAQLDRYMTEAKSVGATSVRVGLDWSVIEPTQGKFDWLETDRVIDAAVRHGIEPLAIVTYTPDWARVSGRAENDSHLIPVSPFDYGKFAGIAAARYAGKIQLWEIWNEPNIVSFFSPAPDLQIYVEMLRAAYTEIHRVLPEATVLSGGTAPADNRNGNISADQFVQGLYDKGAAEYFDGIAVHPYSFPALPTSTADWNSFRLIPVIRALMIENQDQDKMIWVTEFGAPTAAAPNGVTEAGQRSIVISGIDQTRSLGYIASFYIFTLIDAGDDRSDLEDNFGLFDMDWQPKAGATALEEIAAQECR